MTKKVAIWLVTGIFLLLAAFFYFSKPAAVPAGQQPLLTLSTGNIGDFQKWFDAQVDAPRMILLLSPT